MSKLTVTAFNVDQVFALDKLEHVENIILGNSDFGLRNSYEFSLEEISKLSDVNAKLWVMVNKLMHKSDVDKLTEYLPKLQDHNIFGVIFSDLAVFETVKNNNLSLELMYGTETSITNNSFTEFAHDFGIYGVELAKEISLEKITSIAKHKKSVVSINVHGYIYMYQSVRKMITNYGALQNKTFDNQAYLYDEERDLYYPIVEDNQGTHVLASHDICLIQKLDEIVNTEVDFLKIDGFLYDQDVYFEIVKLYDEVLTKLSEGSEFNLREYFKQIKTIASDKKFNTGFLYKETMF